MPDAPSLTDLHINAHMVARDIPVPLAAAIADLAHKTNASGEAKQLGLSDLRKIALDAGLDVSAVDPERFECWLTVGRVG